MGTFFFKVRGREGWPKLPQPGPKQLPGVDSFFGILLLPGEMIQFQIIASAKKTHQLEIDGHQNVHQIIFVECPGNIAKASIYICHGWNNRGILKHNSCQWKPSKHVNDPIKIGSKQIRWILLAPYSMCGQQRPHQIPRSNSKFERTRWRWLCLFLKCFWSNKLFSFSNQVVTWERRAGSCWWLTWFGMLPLPVAATPHFPIFLVGDPC